MDGTDHSESCGGGPEAKGAEGVDDAIERRGLHDLDGRLPDSPVKQAKHILAKSFKKFPPHLHHKISRMKKKFSEIFPDVVYLVTSNPRNFTL